jgi:hypothetical protein
VTRPREDLLRVFAIQMRHLAASCHEYDAGDEWESLRLATIIHTLVHDAGSNRSILGLLGIKHQMFFMSSAALSAEDARKQNHRPFDNKLRYTPLIEYETYKDLREKDPTFKPIPHFVPVSTYWARRNMYPALRELSFEDWWESDLIFIDEDAALSRKKLAFTLRNQEGGSHFDGRDAIDPSYVRLRQPGWMNLIGYGFGKYTGLELITMRQIAEEVRISVVVHRRMARLKQQHVQAA